jgi:hypothetical protein
MVIEDAVTRGLLAAQRSRRAVVRHPELLRRTAFGRRSRVADQSRGDQTRAARQCRGSPPLHQRVD